MILLTSFVMCLSTLASFRSIKSYLFYFYITILSSILMGVFLTLDLIPFYICFESSLIPMFLLIGSFGSDKKRKIYAAFSIMLTTLIGSLIMLLTILSIYSFIGSNLYLIANNLSNERQNIL
jgi:NADH:ubiquinone oxidoreductase subunit 4 (subunit M)